jgi:hypothetical protein
LCSDVAEVASPWSILCPNLEFKLWCEFYTFYSDFKMATTEHLEPYSSNNESFWNSFLSFLNLLNFYTWDLTALDPTGSTLWTVKLQCISLIWLKVSSSMSRLNPHSSSPAPHQSLSSDLMAGLSSTERVLPKCFKDYIYIRKFGNYLIDLNWTLYR